MLAKKWSLLILCCTFLIAGAASGAWADDAKPADDKEKQEVIKQLLDASRAVKNAQMGFNMVMEQEFKGVHSAVLARIDQDPKMSDEEKQKAKTALASKLDKRMDRFRELTAQKIDLSKAIVDVYLALYDKYFTLGELKDMLAYYKSPTGQRSLDVLPQLTSEGIQSINSVVVPQLRAVSAQIDDEEKTGKL